MTKQTELKPRYAVRRAAQAKALVSIHPPLPI